MNPNENNDPGAQEAQEASYTQNPGDAADAGTQAGEGGATAADAASDLGGEEEEYTKNLNAYEKWQLKWSDHLFDGTYSQQSYIRLAFAPGIEYGIQPRLIAHGSHLHICGLQRVAYIVSNRASAEGAIDQKVTEEDVQSNIAGLCAFFADGDKQSWSKRNAYRLSRPFDFSIPLSPKEPNALNQFVGVIGEIFDKMVSRLPTPAAGWDLGELRRAKTQFLEYLQITINQFGLFDTKVVTITENKWTDDTTVAEPSEQLVTFLQALDASQDGDAEEAATDANGEDNAEANED